MAHMHYKGTGKVHSFRGLLPEGDAALPDEERTIRIQGPVGDRAWRITKFELAGADPGSTENFQTVVQIWREKQTATGTAINFDDDELLAAGVYNFGATGTAPGVVITIFDNALFSRNIYVNQSTRGGVLDINYYIELEEVKVRLDTFAYAWCNTCRRGESVSLLSLSGKAQGPRCVRDAPTSKSYNPFSPLARELMIVCRSRGCPAAV